MEQSRKRKECCSALPLNPSFFSLLKYGVSVDNQVRMTGQVHRKHLNCTSNLPVLRVSESFVLHSHHRCQHHFIALKIQRASLAVQQKGLIELSLARNLMMKKGTLEEKSFWWKVVSMSCSVIPCDVQQPARSH